MAHRKLHDGADDGLQPLLPIDLDRIESFADLLEQMSQTAFSGRQLGDAFSYLCEMVQSPSCQVVLTLSGAMTVAKQGKIISDMIDRGVVHAVVSTGALIAHGLTESIGRTHFRYDPRLSDTALFERGYNRIYDTLEMEANLNDVERLVSTVLEENRDEQEWSSHRFCRALGKKLHEADQGPGILRSAYEKGVPVFIPAFTDSEVGLDMAIWAMAAKIAAARRDGQSTANLAVDDVFVELPSFNPFADLHAYAKFATAADELGILTIGGGVPRNWAQQVAPLIDITNSRLGTELPPPQFRYGIRICPEPTHWGGLSGCTYSEGVSWGKFVAPHDGGRYAEVYADATVVLPLLIKALFERIDEQSNRTPSGE